MHREGTNPTYRTCKMYSCGSCFFWSCFSSQNFGDVFPCTKKSMMKERYVFAKKNVHGRDASARSARGHHILKMARTQPHCPTQTDRIRAKRRSVWGRALELALQVGPQLRKPTIGKPPPRPPRDGRTPGRECLFWPMPPYYSYYL